MRTGELYQRYNGLYIATVVDIDDPSGLGRIRLKTDQYDDSSMMPFGLQSHGPSLGRRTPFTSRQRSAIR